MNILIAPDSFKGSLSAYEFCEVIEMSSTSGLPLLKTSERNPMRATSYGSGELIKDALDIGCEKILLGVGGSATNDGGLGALSALGAKFYNEKGDEISHGAKGLLELKSVDLSSLDKRLFETEIIIACDVDNPLYGVNGAAYVYGKQKGADDSILATLDEALINLSQVIINSTGKDISSIKVLGAAGGF